VGEGWLGARRGPKEKLGIGKKKAQNGIKTKIISTMTSAGSNKKSYSVFCLIGISSRRPKKKKSMTKSTERFRSLSKRRRKKRGKTHNQVE
jgi:hypothetical protein